MWRLFSLLGQSPFPYPSISTRVYCLWGVSVCFLGRLRSDRAVATLLVQHLLHLTICLCGWCLPAGMVLMESDQTLLFSTPAQPRDCNSISVVMIDANRDSKNERFSCCLSPLSSFLWTAGLSQRSFKGHGRSKETAGQGLVHGSETEDWQTYFPP